MPTAVGRFYLGTHQPDWLGRTTVPLFISNRRLAGRRTYPRALGPWALDSGGFSELSLYGEWRTTPREYANLAARYGREVGGLEWAAVQDHMCEPAILARTGRNVVDHQTATVVSYLRLHDLAPEMPWAPVLQGYERDDYLRCLDLYDAANLDLTACPVVGVGSICRRQGTADAKAIFDALRPYGLKLHAFGAKITGLQLYGSALASADSLAWSYDARRARPIPGHSHKNCANCIDYALAWLDRLQ